MRIKLMQIKNSFLFTVICLGASLFWLNTYPLMAQESPPESSDSGVSEPEHTGGAGWGSSDHSSRDRHQDSDQGADYGERPAEPITPKPIEDIDDEDKKEEHNPLGIPTGSSSTKGDITPLDFSSQNPENSGKRSQAPSNKTPEPFSKEDLEDKAKYLIGEIKQPGATVFIPTIMFLLALLVFAILKQKNPKPPDDNDW